MGIFGDIGDLFGEQTGFGSNGNPNPHNIDSNAFRYYYDNAKNDLNSVGEGIPTDKLTSALSGQLEGLDNNMAGRKQNFMEDMARGFSADTQNLARAKGGTGGMANAFNNVGSMYDAQSRGTSRGLNDLYSQGTKDLATLGGVQNQLYGQQLSKQGALSNLEMKMRGQEMGVAEQANENIFNSEQAGSARRGNTISGIANAAGSFFAKGGMVDEAEKLAPLAIMMLNKGGSCEPIDGEMYAHAKMPVPGKAKVPGDSLKNDVIDAKLSPGEGIIPRSVMNAPDAPKRAAEFVRDIKANKHKAKPHMFVGGEMPELDAGEEGGEEGGGISELLGGAKKKGPVQDISGIFSNNAKLDMNQNRAKIPTFSKGGDVHSYAAQMLKKRSC